MRSFFSTKLRIIIHSYEIGRRWKFESSDFIISMKCSMFKIKLLSLHKVTIKWKFCTNMIIVFFEYWTVCMRTEIWIWKIISKMNNICIKLRSLKRFNNKNFIPILETWKFNRKNYQLCRNCHLCHLWRANPFEFFCQKMFQFNLKWNHYYIYRFVVFIHKNTSNWSTNLRIFRKRTCKPSISQFLSV